MKKKKQTVGNARKYMVQHESQVPFVLRRRPHPPRARLPFYAVFFIVFLIAGGMVGAAFLGAQIAYENAKLSSSTTVINIDSSDNVTNMKASGEKMTKAGVYNAVYPSIVKIYAGGSSAVNDNGVQLFSGEGSGVIIGNNGEILTNYHVVAGAMNIVVTLANGVSYNVDSFKGDALTDIAVLSINTDTSRVMSTMASSNLVVNMAEEVLFLGYTRNNEDPIISEGIISGIGVEVSIDGVDMSLLQTTVGINPGNSGGGLFNMYGSLVGVVNAKRVGEYIENVSYAIPSPKCLDIASQLIEKNYVEGRVDTNIIEFSEVLKVSSTKPREGLYVTRDNTARGIFSLSDSNYIISVEGREILTKKAWNKILNDHSVGDTLTIKYQKNNEEKIVEVELTLTQKKYCDS